MGEENYVPNINFSGLYNNLYELLPELPLPGSLKNASLLGLANLSSDNGHSFGIENRIESLLHDKDDNSDNLQNKNIKYRLLGQSVASALKSTSLDEFNPLISKLYPHHITTNHFKQLGDQHSPILKEILYIDPSCFNDVPLNNKQINLLKTCDKDSNLLQSFSIHGSHTQNYDDSTLMGHPKFVEGLSERIKKRRRRPTSTYTPVAASAHDNYTGSQEDENATENHLEYLISKKIKTPGPASKASFGERQEQGAKGTTIHRKSYLERVRNNSSSKNGKTGGKRREKKGSAGVVGKVHKNNRARPGILLTSDSDQDSHSKVHHDHGRTKTPSDSEEADHSSEDLSSSSKQVSVEPEPTGHGNARKKKSRKSVQYKDALSIEEIMDTPIFAKFDGLLEKVVEQSEESDIPSLIFRKSKDNNIDDDIEVPVDSLISKSLHNALANESAKMKALGYTSMVNTEKLIRVLNVFIWNIRDGSKVLPLMHEGNEQEEEAKLWEELAWERVFRSADCCITSLQILTSPNISKKLFMDEVIERVIQFAKYHLVNTIYPEFDPVYKVNKSKEFYVKTRRHKSHHVESKSTLQLYAKINEILGLLAELIEVQSMTDSSIIMMSSLGTQPFFVENISDLQLNALRLITAIFAKYEKHRQIILEDILSSLARLPVSKRNLRSYKVNTEDSIQMVSALVLQLIHCIVDFPQNVGNARHLEKFDLSSSNTPDHDVLTLNSYQNAKKTGHTFLAVFLKKCSARSCEEDFRTLFDHFVDDLLVTVNRPEWPASELLLTILGRILVQNFSDRKVEISLRLASLEYLGKITSRLRKDAVSSQYDNHTLQDIINQVKASHEDMIDYKNFKQEPETLKLQRLLLNYLQENSLNDPFIRFARKFIIIQWYCDILLKANKLATAQNSLKGADTRLGPVKPEDNNESAGIKSEQNYSVAGAASSSKNLGSVVKKEENQVGSLASKPKKHKHAKGKSEEQSSSGGEDKYDNEEGAGMSQSSPSLTSSSASSSSDDSLYDPRYKNDNVVSSKYHHHQHRKQQQHRGEGRKGTFKKKKSVITPADPGKKQQNNDLKPIPEDANGGNTHVAESNSVITISDERKKREKKSKTAVSKEHHQNTTDGKGHREDLLTQDEDSLEFIEYHKRFLLSFGRGDGGGTGNTSHTSKARNSVRLDYQQSSFIAKFLSSQRSFSRNYDLYLIQIMKVVNESAIAIRTKAMKCLASIIEADPGILAHPGVQSTVHLRLKDPSPSVREAVVELMGKSILSKPELIPQYFNMLAERILDTGVSVRKRVIRILRDICVDHPHYQNITSICCKLVRRINDEEGIKKLIIEVFQAMWFNPDVSPESLDSKVVHITETVNHFMEYGAEMIETLFECLINNPEDPNYANSYSASQQIVSNLIDSIMKIDENNRETPKLRSQRLVSCLSTLYLFTKIDPDLTVKHCDTLQPYLAHKCSSNEDHMIVHYVAKIFRLTVPKMGHPNPTFLSHLEESLMKLVVTQGMLILESCVACLADIVKNVTHNYVLIADCFIKFIGILYKMALETYDNPDNISRLSTKRPILLRSLYTVGLLCMYFDFDQDYMNISKKMFREKLSFWETQYHNYRKMHTSSSHSSDSGTPSNQDLNSSNSGGAPDSTYEGSGSDNKDFKSPFFNTSIQIPISECVFEIFYHFINSKDEIVKHKALSGLGFFCINHSQYLSHSKTRDMYQHLINDPSVSITIKCQALKNFYSYLLEEEIKTTNANKHWDKTKCKEDFKEIGEASSGVSSAVIQIYLRDILECTLHGDGSVRQSSANVLAMIIKQGLVYPVQCVPYLVAMGTDPNAQIKNKADHILKDIDVKYPGFVSMKALAAARKSFELQKILLNSASTTKDALGASCVRGAVLPPPSNILNSPLVPNYPVAAIGFLYTLLRNSKSQRRFFVDSLLKLFDEQVKVPLEELLYVADNLAYFPYVNQEEPLFVLHQMEVMTSLTGCNILQAFSECFGKDQNKYKYEEEDDEDIETLLRTIPDNPTALYECCVASQGYFLLLHLRQFLKSVYGFTDNKLTNYSPMDTSKVFDKPVNRKQASFFNPKSIIKYVIQGAPPTEYTPQEKLHLIRQYLEFKEMMLKLDPSEEDDDDIKAVKASKEAKANRMSLYKISKSMREKSTENGDISYTIEQVRNTNESNAIPKVHIRLNKPAATGYNIHAAPPTTHYNNVATPTKASHASSRMLSPHKQPQVNCLKGSPSEWPSVASSGNIFEGFNTNNSTTAQPQRALAPPEFTVIKQTPRNYPSPMAVVSNSSTQHHPYDISNLISPTSRAPPSKINANPMVVISCSASSLSFADALNGVEVVYQSGDGGQQQQFYNHHQSYGGSSRYASSNNNSPGNAKYNLSPPMVGSQHLNHHHHYPPNVPSSPLLYNNQSASSPLKAASKSKIPPTFNNNQSLLAANPPPCTGNNLSILPPPPVPMENKISGQNMSGFSYNLYENFYGGGGGHS